MVCFDMRNPDVGTFTIVTIDVIGLKLEKNMFRVGVSIEESF
jgi:hypothetical protein